MTVSRQLPTPHLLELELRVIAQRFAGKMCRRGMARPWLNKLAFGITTKLQPPDLGAGTATARDCVASVIAVEGTKALRCL